MHKILLRQLRRYLQIEDENLVPEHLRDFVVAISAAYDHFDEDRQLLERSIDISSNELQQINEKLKQEIATVKSSKAENRELEQMNKLMVGRELRMVELKNELAELQKKLDELQRPTA